MEGPALVSFLSLLETYFVPHKAEGVRFDIIK